MHEWGQEPIEVYVVPGNYYKVEVPAAVLRDRAKFEEYVQAVISHERAQAWYMHPIPAWLCLCVVALVVLGLIAEIIYPLGL